MKKTLVLYLAIIVATQLSAQKYTDHQFAALLKFGDTYLLMQNKFLLDSARKYMPFYIKQPFTDERFTVTGPWLKLSIAPSDSIIHYNLGFSSMLIDSSSADKDLFKFSNIQIKVSRNGKAMIDWKSPENYPSFFMDTLTRKKDVKKSYWLINDSIKINDSLLVEFRNKLNEVSFYRIHIKRVGLPITPFLQMMEHDSTSKSENDFIQEKMSTKDSTLKQLHNFYEYWSSNYGAGFASGPYFSSSKLAFYFRKPNKNYPDFSLEYKLVGNQNSDTTWHKSGHLIFVTNLQPNSRYSLYVRYANAPENVWKNSIYIAPRWYQTNRFYLIAAIVSALTLILLTFLILYFLNKRKLRLEQDKKERLQLELTAIRSQLNPHFVFNALSSIQSLINQNKIDDANHYLTEFSTLLRESLHNNNREYIPIFKEIQLLEIYIKLEQLRFNFNYIISITPSIDQNLTEIPALLLQPTIENAIKHGISFMHNKGIISIVFSTKENDLLATISDNGKGFKTEVTYLGHGLRLTKERIQVLNKSLKEQQINFSINSNETGTTVDLNFKNWL